MNVQKSLKTDLHLNQKRRHHIYLYSQQRGDTQLNVITIVIAV